jgi:hypothetical protein
VGKFSILTIFSFNQNHNIFRKLKKGENKLGKYTTFLKQKLINSQGK